MVLVRTDTIHHLLLVDDDFPCPYLSFSSLVGVTNGETCCPVSVSRARILGSPELYVKAGSDVNLTCEVSHNTSVIYWYHDGDVINFRGERRLRVETAANASRLVLIPVRMKRRNSIGPIDTSFFAEQLFRSAQTTTGVLDVG